jgi:hypothetical protein
LPLPVWADRLPLVVQRLRGKGSQRKGARVSNCRDPIALSNAYEDLGIRHTYDDLRRTLG